MDFLTAEQRQATSLNQSLLRIGKGAGLAIAGSLVAIFFGLISRVLIARFGTEADYGVFSLAFVILNISVIIATLGLQHGAVRSIAYARGKDDIERVQKLIPASLQFGVVASISLGIVVFFASDIIANKVFHDAALAFPLKVFAFGIPFFTLINVFVSIFRGFGEIGPTVYFQDILKNLLFVVFLLPIVFLSLPFAGAFYAFVASQVISLIGLIVYAVKRLPYPIQFRTRAIASPVGRELLLFSLPLLGVAMLNMIIAWTDTLMLGGLKTSAEVGLYNAAHPLAHFISVPLMAMLLIYLPVASGLYARRAMAEMSRNFSILTKWLCSATLPLFLVLFLFPETVLGSLFGASYTAAAPALRILSIGFIINNYLGPNGATLIAMGEARFMMWSALAAAVLNIGLNIALIPPLGLEGAAIASVAAITSINLIRCWKFYSLSKAQPLSKNLLKTTFASLALILLFQFVLANFVDVVWWMLPLLFILYYGMYALAILLTKSFDQEDIAMLLAIEKRTGINATSVKRILRRFL
jgi:O-antigen/teichoic acid export membrane protein